MPNTTLVTYASRYGATAEIAQRIGDTLTSSGHTVKVSPIADVDSLDGYKAVVIGGSIYSGEWPPDLIEWVGTHLHALRQMPCAVFVTAARLRDSSDAMRLSVHSSISKHIIFIEPAAVGYFGGAVDYGKLSPIVRMQLQTKGLPEGDFRDWYAIDAWARALPEQFAEPAS